MNGGSVGGAASLPKELVAGREWSADTIEDVNAATAMLALKHGPKIFTESSFRNGNPPVITTSPSEDHTYSAGGVGVQEQLAVANGAAANGGTAAAVVANGFSCCSSSDERYEPPQHSKHHQHHHNHHQPAPQHHTAIHHAHQPQQHSIRHSDNVSNGTSSDATYESSEER
uniref:Uncharacterized protein n=1 Tax=Anopheles quadriannulatus TaxID=34691 RepID=A0A182WXS1_ANOQN